MVVSLNSRLESNKEEEKIRLLERRRGHGVGASGSWGVPGLGVVGVYGFCLTDQSSKWGAVCWHSVGWVGFAAH